MTPNQKPLTKEEAEENIEVLLEDLEQYFDNRSDIVDQDDGTYRANEEMQFHARIKLAQIWQASLPSNDKQEQATDIEKLLAFLAQYGGEIVSTAKLTPEWIEQARASGRLYVDENSLGYVWEPDINGFPTTEQKVEEFEKWYPLDVELPESLKNTDWIFDKLHENKKSAILIKRDGERTFTLTEILQVYDHTIGNCKCEDCQKTRVEFFKKTFSIDIENKQL